LRGDGGVGGGGGGVERVFLGSADNNDDDEFYLLGGRDYIGSVRTTDAAEVLAVVFVHKQTFIDECLYGSDCIRVFNTSVITFTSKNARHPSSLQHAQKKI
jgi:hypothetical protein